MLAPFARALGGGCCAALMLVSIHLDAGPSTFAASDKSSPSSRPLGLPGCHCTGAAWSFRTRRGRGRCSNGLPVIVQVCPNTISFA